MQHSIIFNNVCRKGEGSPAAKLDDMQALTIITFAGHPGYKPTELSERYGLHKCYASVIQRGVARKHLWREFRE